MRKDFSNPCHLNIEKWWRENVNIFMKKKIYTGIYFWVWPKELRVLSIKWTFFLNLFTYHADVSAQINDHEGDYALINKRRVVKFVDSWSLTINDAFWEDKTIIAFLEVSWWLNLLWPSDVIWWQGSRSTLTQVMACCLTAPSHYLNQCWLVISEVLWHSPDNTFTENT